MLKSVIKRDGAVVPSDNSKIKSAVEKAMRACNLIEAEHTDKVMNIIEDALADAKEELHVDEIHRLVEQSLVKADYKKVSNAYKKYRMERETFRKKSDKLYLQISNITEVADRENANVGNGPCAKLLQMGEAASKEKAVIDLISKEVLEAMDYNKIYPHDASWYTLGTTTCCYIPFDKLLSKGFSTGHGSLRTPKGIKCAAALSAIIFQSNQNDQHGGQSSSHFDRDLAPYVKIEFENQLKKIRNILEVSGGSVTDEQLDEMAWGLTVRETQQAMEAFIANLNTMHSRAGAQVPFTSVNIGTDVTREGRLIAECLMKAYDNGLGKGEQPLFPNIIFKVKDGVNYEEDTPNHDLLQLSMKITANRLYPIYNFQDCTLNKDFKEDVPSMGCRTRVAYDRFQDPDNQTVSGRGNLSFTSINLPGIALAVKYDIKESKLANFADKYKVIEEKYDINIPVAYSSSNLVKAFFVELNNFIDLTTNQLMDRYKYQSKFYKKDFLFLMQQDVWMGAENLDSNDSVKEILKHGTLGVGFIGLAEALVCLVGKHHAEDQDAQKLGLEIIKYMATKVNQEASDLYDMNFGLLGTPAEGLTGKFLEKDVELYGVVKGVTDKEWYTNSTHCPVEYNQGLFEKVRIESEYIKYLTAGNITYMELTESPKDNPTAVYNIVKFLHNNDIALGAINFPCDRCRDCNEAGTIENECPVCGSTDISRIRRITGYLAEATNFNHAKYEEMTHRVKHNRPCDLE